MKIIIQKSIIENILIHATPFLEKKDFSQITSHIFINVQDNLLTILATDHEIGFKVQTNKFTSLENGSATANGKKFLDIIKILKDGEINIELIKENLTITQASSKFKLPIFNYKEFPEFPTYNNSQSINIDSNIFIDAFKKITTAIDNNNPKQELNGALVDIKDNIINFASTDTKRLAVVSVENQNQNQLELIIPKKAILEIQKLFSDNIELFFDETNLIIISEQYMFFTKLINGKFPDYKRIIPQTLKYNLRLPKAQIIEAIKQITTISNDIKLTFTSQKITFESLSTDNIEAKTDILFNSDIDENIIMAINSRYLLDFLSAINSSEFVMGINQENLPFVLSDENYKTVVMPIIL